MRSSGRPSQDCARVNARVPGVNTGIVSVFSAARFGQRLRSRPMRVYLAPACENVDFLPIVFAKRSHFEPVPRKFKVRPAFLTSTPVDEIACPLLVAGAPRKKNHSNLFSNLYI